jgi:hypothetical protein
MGLSTLPMPRGSSAELGYDYDWAGTRLGNVHTCNAQGFFFSLGIITMFVYTASLCLYYTLAIAFRLEEKRIVKYWEPFFHAVPLILGLAGSIYPLVTGNIIPTGWEAWCTFEGNGYTEGTQQNVAWMLLIVVLSLLTFILLNFAFIIWRVAATERALKRAVRRRNTNNNLQTNYYQRHPHLQRIVELRNGQAQQNAIESMQNTRVIFVQALAYFVSFLITLSMPILRNLPGSMISSLKNEENELIIVRLQIVLMPLQGLFNTLIFIYHKIYNYRRIHPDVSRFHVLMLVFYGKADDHVLFSRISMVSVNSDNSIDINMHNERNEVNHIHIPMNEEEKEFDGFDEEVFLDEDETSRRDLSGFSSLPSNGVSLKNEKDSNITNDSLKRSSDSVVSWFSRSGKKKAPANTPTTVPSKGFSP